MGIPGLFLTASIDSLVKPTSPAPGPKTTKTCDLGSTKTCDLGSKKTSRPVISTSRSLPLSEKFALFAQENLQDFKC